MDCFVSDGLMGDIDGSNDITYLNHKNMHTVKRQPKTKKKRKDHKKKKLNFDSMTINYLMFSSCYLLTK